ncbi:MAG: SDR family NAD(P)-dependent oxidoreductase [Acidimicrobiia bacterium]
MEILRDRVAVVTGASGGIGLGIVEQFVGEGMHVVMVDIAEQRLRREADRLRAAGASVESAVVDVGDAVATEVLAHDIVDRRGSVHVLVNNAGIIRTGLTWELAHADWEDVLRVNLMGVVNGIHAFVPHMIAGGYEAHVVNVGSMASVTPVPGIGPYNASKHAVLGLSEAMAAEFAMKGHTIGVTVVMPGRVATNLGRPIDGPDAEVAAEPGLIQPAEVGRQVVQAIRANRLHLFTHPERIPDVRARFARITDG